MKKRVVLEISDKELEQRLEAQREWIAEGEEASEALGIIRDYGTPVAFLNDDLGLAADAADLLASIDEGENVDSDQLRTVAARLRDLAESLA